MTTERSSNATGDEDSDALREELKHLKDEADELKAKLSAFEHAEDVQEEGSISVAEQISAQVEEIRKELNTRHEQRVKQAEEKYKARAQSMKEQLNKTLVAARAEIQEKLEASNVEAVRTVKQQHDAEIEALNQRHSAEIAELRRHSVSSEPNAQKRSIGTVDSSSGNEGREFSESEVKDMLQNNALARKLVTNSLNNRERKVREEEQQKIKEELAEVEAKIAKAKKDAEGMVEAKFAAKFNLSENRMKAAQAKVEYVQNASKETPDMTVKEVWMVAKDIKGPTPVLKAASIAQPAAGNTATQGQSGASPAADPKPTPQESSSAPSPAQTNPFGSRDKPNPFAGQASQPGGASPGKESATPTAGSSTQQTQAQPTTQRASRVPSLQQSSHAPNSGAAGRGQQSGLPVASGSRGGQQARGGSQRGRGNSNIGRPGVRGGGAGRGAGPAVNTALGQNAQAGPGKQDSPRGSNSMNAEAQQFVPGQKRSRDDNGLGASEFAVDKKRMKSDEE